MREPSNIEALVKTRIDWMGLIFYSKSPRFVSAKLNVSFGPGIKKVGVFVNEPIDVLQDTVEEYGLDMVQLHGEEPIQYCDSVRGFVDVTKAFKIKDKADFDVVTAYDSIVDYFLFDTKSSKGHGGTGEQFDWELLEHYHGETPFLLSGGIGLEDAIRLKTIDHPQLVGFDVNSGFETEPGLKNIEAIRDFIEQIKQ